MAMLLNQIQFGFQYVSGINPKVYRGFGKTLFPKEPRVQDETWSSHVCVPGPVILCLRHLCFCPCQASPTAQLKPVPTAASLPGSLSISAPTWYPGFLPLSTQ